MEHELATIKVAGPIETTEVARAHVRLASYREAEDRARALLRFHLTPDQCRDLDRHGYFLVRVGRRRVGRGFRRAALYRIRSGGCTYPVEILRPRVRHRCLGIGFNRPVPDSDLLLALKLSLEADDRHILKLACRGG